MYIGEIKSLEVIICDLMSIEEGSIQNSTYANISPKLNIVHNIILYLFIPSNVSLHKYVCHMFISMCLFTFFNFIRFAFNLDPGDINFVEEIC